MSSSYGSHGVFMNPRDSPFNNPKPIVHLPESLADSVAEAAKPYPIPEGKKYEYGTAGVGETGLVFETAERLMSCQSSSA